MTALPTPADFAPPPDERRLRAWAWSDGAARPGRLERVRRRLVEGGFDAYLGIRPEHMRYLTGFTLRNGEEMVSGDSGKFLVGLEEVVVFSDSRYAIQAGRECPEARIENVYNDLPARWPGLAASVGARRVATEASCLSHATWEALVAAAPDVELVAVGGWVEADRATKEPAELERIAAACAVADRALAALLPAIRPGVTEQDLALRLEWEMRTNGAEALAFDVACLSGPEAALPHGSPSARELRAGEVVLFDFGAQVAGYRSDMTRTLFLGEPPPRDADRYDLVRRAQSAALDGIAGLVAAGGPLPDGRTLDALARDVIEAAGEGDRFGHGLGHGIGLATHELPSLSRRAGPEPLPARTVFSIEPGVYVEGESGVRIEDLLAVDVEARKVERLTRFPREMLVLES
jgi:Xaa-Pro aminopeptidase/Xaa-Pro dipeptidase